MGTPIDRKEKINELKRSSANNYIAEVFFEELQFILKEDLLDSLMIICPGMNPRVHSKDILSEGSCCPASCKEQYVSSASGTPVPSPCHKHTGNEQQGNCGCDT